jgi:hypothetical protein
MASPAQKRKAFFLALAKRHLNSKIETLDQRMSDSLDFYDVPVWGIADALEAAYQRGLEIGRAIGK